MSILDLHTGSVVLADWIHEGRFEEEGELDPVIDQLLQELEGSITQKVENYCRFIRELELTLNARKEEAERLMALSNTDANLVKRLRARLHMFMDLQGVEKLETKSFKIGICNNGGLLPIQLTEADLMPAYWRPSVPTVDMEMIRKDIAAGIEVKGVTVGTRGKHLRIK